MTLSPFNQEEAEHSVELVEDRLPSGVSWPENMRGCPRVLTRCSFFGIIPSALPADDDRRFFVLSKLPTAKGLSVEATGRRLSSAHRDAWLECLHLARYEALGALITSTDADLLAALGVKSRGGRERREARALVQALTKTEVKLSGLGATFQGTLLEDVGPGEDRGSFVFRVPPAIWPVMRSGYVQLKVSDRLALQGDQLALWLHAFYAGHHRIIPLKPDTLAAYCGSSLRGERFRKRLKLAMDLIRSKTGLFEWVFDANRNVAVFRKDQASEEYQDLKRERPDAAHHELVDRLARLHLYEYGPDITGKAKQA